jgi:Xaa-Pro aminopeptidase
VPIQKVLLVSLLTVGILSVAPVTGHAQVVDAPVLYDTDFLTPEFHRSRRQGVLSSLPAHSVAVFFSAPQRTRENDVNFEFRQSSDLIYLTGTHEPGSVLLLSSDGIDVDGEIVHEVLMVPERNPDREVWTGRLFGDERAQQILGIEKAVTIDRFEELLAASLTDARFYHLPLPTGIQPGSVLATQIDWVRENASLLEPDVGGFLPRIFSMMLSASDSAGFARGTGMADRFGESFEGSNVEYIVGAFSMAEDVDEWLEWRGENIDDIYADGIALRGTVNGLRAIKTEAELAVMQRAIDNTTAAHREAMRSIEPGTYEYEIEALVEYIFRRNGSEYTGFPSIIGSGENSVILHYETNRRQMQAEDMVVMDIGAEYHHYSADVTRTVPVDGVYSPEQKIIYELVLQAADAGIAATRSDSSVGAPHRAASQVLLEGMKDLGLVVEDADLRRFFMHGTSHYLGMYVHDVGTGGNLEPGTVITVEPGIYIAAADDIDPKWWNIGVRIEDDILVTDGDPINMSAGAPRTVAEIEALMRETGLGNSSAGVVGTR